MILYPRFSSPITSSLFFILLCFLSCFSVFFLCSSFALISDFCYGPRVFPIFLVPIVVSLMISRRWNYFSLLFRSFLLLLYCLLFPIFPIFLNSAALGCLVRFFCCLFPPVPVLSFWFHQLFPYLFTRVAFSLLTLTRCEGVI